MGNLANLQTLSLYDNQLTGAIPAELGGLSNLDYLYLFNNQLTGAIPAELGGLSNLEYLYLRSNQLTGCIPEGVRYIRINDFGQLGLPFCGEPPVRFPPCPSTGGLPRPSRPWCTA